MDVFEPGSLDIAAITDLTTKTDTVMANTEANTRPIRPVNTLMPDSDPVTGTTQAANPNTDNPDPDGPPTTPKTTTTHRSTTHTDDRLFYSTDSEWNSGPWSTVSYRKS